MSTIRRLILLVAILLAFLFLISAAMNLGAEVQIGATELGFTSPSASIAVFEVSIGIVLLAAAVVSNLYLYGGAFLFTTVGIAEGLLSADVQGLARTIHETMVPFALAGWILIALEANRVSRTERRQPSGERKREIIVALQFFVGGLVTLGGAAYATGGTYPLGTALGLVHLSVGLTGLFAGYAILRRAPWSRRFLIWTNVVTIVYSAFSESLAQIYALLPPGITDSLVGTIIAILVGVVIIYLLRYPVGHGEGILAATSKVGSTA